MDRLLNLQNSTLEIRLLAVEQEFLDAAFGNRLKGHARCAKCVISDCRIYVQLEIGDSKSSVFPRNFSRLPIGTRVAKQTHAAFSFLSRRIGRWKCFSLFC